jgi:hypothetical protein
MAYLLQMLELNIDAFISKSPRQVMQVTLIITSLNQVFRVEGGCKLGGLVITLVTCLSDLLMFIAIINP